MALIGYTDKTPAETETLAVEFLDRLPSGVTVSSGTVTAVDEDGTTDETVLGSTTATISGTQTQFVVQAGTHGKFYTVKVTTTLSNSAVRVDEIQMRVVNR
jgi:hypothetical protein